MSFKRSTAKAASDRNGQLTRRTVLALAASGAFGISLTGFTKAESVQPLYRTSRPPLPAMGPSLREEITYHGSLPAGTIEINTKTSLLVLVLGSNRAYRYQISVGREGFGWAGNAVVGEKKRWPEWRPPAEMRQRVLGLPEMVPPGPYNPLGARALYLHRNGRDTLYRIHGTNDPDGVGFDGTSGCFRLTNTDIIDLWDLVPVGTKTIVI